MDELAVIIGQELAHHAMDHTAFFRNLLIAPGRIIPFVGAAYGRACKLTADRIGYVLSSNCKAAQNSLIDIALDTQSLADEIDIEQFETQEHEIPDFMDFIHKIFSSHPRMTRRAIIINLDYQSKRQPHTH